MKYDINLFEQLNEEYTKKPIMKSFTQYTDDYQFMEAKARLQNLNKIIALKGKRVLEIGCGGGYVCRKLYDDYECIVTGIDIYKSEVWSRLQKDEKVEFLVIDLSKENPFKQKEFDLIISYVTFEHIRHPYTVLCECNKILKDDGVIFIQANQYRSAVASHLYRNVYFPYPHLLFSEDVIIDYCLKNGVEMEWIERFFYINKLTYSHYKEYFSILKFNIDYEKLYLRPLDVDFYNRFREKLELYPVFDLKLDFFDVLLSKK